MEAAAATRVAFSSPANVAARVEAAFVMVERAADANTCRAVLTLLKREALTYEDSSAVNQEEFAAMVEPSGLASAEVHGLLTGFLCAGGIWEDASDEEIEILLPNTDGRVVRGLLDEVHGELGSLSMEFSPLIPDDEHQMSERLAGLAAWCAGFLAGFGMGVGEERLSGETEEMLTDLQAISEIKEDEEDSDEGEVDFMQVFEYARIAALTLHGTLPMQSRFKGDDE